MATFIQFRISANRISIIHLILTLAVALTLLILVITHGLLISAEQPASGKTNNSAAVEPAEGKTNNSTTVEQSAEGKTNNSATNEPTEGKTNISGKVEQSAEGNTNISATNEPTEGKANISGKFEQSAEGKTNNSEKFEQPAGGNTNNSTTVEKTDESKTNLSENLPGKERRRRSNGESGSGNSSYTSTVGAYILICALVLLFITEDLAAFKLFKASSPNANSTDAISQAIHWLVSTSTVIFITSVATIIAMHNMPSWCWPILSITLVYHGVCCYYVWRFIKELKAVASGAVPKV